MGAWSNKPLGNDTALDWLDQLDAAQNGKRLIGNTLKAAAEADYIDAPMAEEVVAAASVVAAAAQERLTGIYEDVRIWIERTGFSPGNDLKRLALEALKKVVSESELKDLYDESGNVEDWVKEIEKMQGVLTGVLNQDSPSRIPKTPRLPRSIYKLVDLYLKDSDKKIEQRIIEKFSKIDDPKSQGSATDYDLPLNLAAKSGISESVRILVEKGADVNARSRYGHNAISLACATGDVKTVRLLVENGANIYESYPQYNEEGCLVNEKEVCVAILCAARKGSPELLRLLMDYGADIEAKDLNGESLLHKAAESGNHGLLEFLVSSGLNVNHSKGSVDGDVKWQGEYPLHYAVKSRQLRSAKKLVELGADVNALEYFIGNKHVWFNTPLDLLEGKEEHELYDFLVAKGAVKAVELEMPGLLLKPKAR